MNDDCNLVSTQPLAICSCGRPDSSDSSPHRGRRCPLSRLIARRMFLCIFLAAAHRLNGGERNFNDAIAPARAGDRKVTRARAAAPTHRDIRRHGDGAMAKSDTPKELLEALDLIRGTRGPKPESLDVLEAKHVDRVRTILEDPNIVAIGIAEKRTENKKTGELGLCFYVEKKIAKARVKSNRIIPPVLGVADRRAVFTDVQEIGKVRPQVNKRKSPLLSGFSVGNDTDTGTLGAIVKKGKKLFLLSNSHVLARSGKGKAGDEIIYPG